MDRYNHREIEIFWQKKWEELDIFKAPDDFSEKKY